MFGLILCIIIDDAPPPPVIVPPPAAVATEVPKPVPAPPKVPEASPNGDAVTPAPAWYRLSNEPGVEGFGTLRDGQVWGITARRYARLPVYRGCPPGGCPTR